MIKGKTQLAAYRIGRYDLPMKRLNQTSPSRAILLLFGFSLILAALSLSVGHSVSALDDPVLRQEATANLPTATPTSVGGPTATPSRTPTLVPVQVEAIGEANLRSGPGLDFDIVGQITVGNPVPVIGRSLQWPWYLVKWDESPSGQAWVFEQLVIVIGDITVIPFVDAPTLPTIDPTDAAIQETAQVLLQTPGAAETATATAFFLPTGVFTQTPNAAGGIGGSAPTFTPPAGDAGIDGLRPTTTPPSERGGPAPAVMIISLAAMGGLMLILGVIRRIG